MRFAGAISNKGPAKGSSKAALAMRLVIAQNTSLGWGGWVAGIKSLNSRTVAWNIYCVQPYEVRF